MYYYKLHISLEIESLLLFPKFYDLFIIPDFSFACELLGLLAAWMSSEGQNIGARAHRAPQSRRLSVGVLRRMVVDTMN